MRLVGVGETPDQRALLGGVRRGRALPADCGEAFLEGGSSGGSGGGGWRRPLSRSALRQRLVAIRYGHARTDDRSSKPASPRQAALPGPIALPDHAGLLLPSAPLEDGRLPADAAVWLRTA